MESAPQDPELPRGRKPAEKFSALFKRHRIVEDPIELEGAELSPELSNLTVDRRKIRTKLHRKAERDFPNLRHVQKLDMPRGDEPDALPSDGALWTMAVSPDGIYLAAAGSAKVVWVWTVLYRHEGESNGGLVFAQKPVRIFKGHKDEIQKLAWSSNNFLISASLDHTVRLWHVERDECLSVFEHPDIVTSVCFHPTDSRFFLSGCFDARVRLWSIPDRECAFKFLAPSRISAVAFDPKGGMVFAGSFEGQILILSTTTFKLKKKLQVGGSSVFAGSLRVTGIEIFMDEDEAVSRVKMLITSNGSRLRMYDLQTLNLDCKYRGASIEYSQSAASLSPDKHWVIAPSENRQTYIWARTESGTGLINSSTKNQSCESFRSNKGAVTCAIFAPQTTKNLMSYVGNIIVSADSNGEIRVYHNPEKPVETSSCAPGKGIFRSFPLGRVSTNGTLSEPLPGAGA